MRKSLLFSLLICLGFSLMSAAKPLPANSFPSNVPTHLSPEMVAKILSMKVKDVEKLTGKKMSLKEKIGFSIMKYRLKKDMQRSAKGKGKAGSKRGSTALLIALIGLGAIFIPYLVVLSIPCAIIALVIGYDARRDDPSDRKARTAIILGWVTIAIVVIALILVIAILSSFSFGYG